MKMIADDLCSQAAQAFETNKGNARAAARQLGLAPSTFNHRLRQATLRGFTSYTAGDIPLGLRVSKVSTYYSDGKVKGQWVQTKGDVPLEDTIEIIQEAFNDFKTPHKPTTTPKSSDKDLLTVYPLADLHLGMYSWMEETGADYDLDIATKLMNRTADSLISSSPNSDTALVLNLGDFFHSDNNENRTRRGGNALDVDTRYAKVLRTGVSLFVSVVERALEKHRKVIVRSLPGNHDPYASLTLAVALDAYFRNDDRVTVDTDPNPFFWFRHGQVLLGATHGDMAKPMEMIGVMAAKRAKEWGDTKYRYCYLGHVHQRSMGGGEGRGAIWETFQTISPKDSWSNSMGFTSGRSMVSITHHKDLGEVTRVTVGVRGPE